MTHPAKFQRTFKQRAKSVAIAKSIRILSFSMKRAINEAIPVRLLAYSLAKHAKNVQPRILKLRQYLAVCD